MDLPICVASGRVSKSLASTKSDEREGKFFIPFDRMGQHIRRHKYVLFRMATLTQKVATSISWNAKSRLLHILFFGIGKSILHVAVPR